MEIKTHWDFYSLILNVAAILLIKKVFSPSFLSLAGHGSALLCWVIQLYDLFDAVKMRLLWIDKFDNYIIYLAYKESVS